MGLGLISFFLFVILVVTGILLMFYYVPSTAQAYDRMLDLQDRLLSASFFEICTAGQLMGWWRRSFCTSAGFFHRSLQEGRVSSIGYWVLCCFS